MVFVATKGIRSVRQKKTTGKKKGEKMVQRNSALQRAPEVEEEGKEKMVQRNSALQRALEVEEEGEEDVAVEDGRKRMMI
jgi:hypothetical protein